MTKLLLPIFVTFLLLTLWFAPPVGGLTLPYKSIQPLQRIKEGTLGNICTSFSINEAQGYWLTAAHCIEDELVLVNGHPIVVIFTDPLADTVVYEERHVTAIPLAIKAPAVGDEIYVLGYPYGAFDVITFFGRASGHNVRLDDTGKVDIYNVLGLPGQSGGPILDKSLRVVGLGHMSTKTGAMFGPTYEAFVASVGRFWEL